jgi:hypothetical protein
LWPKSHLQRDSHRKARDNNKLWPNLHHEVMFRQKFKILMRITTSGMYMFLLFFCKVHELLSRWIFYVEEARGSIEDS